VRSKPTGVLVLRDIFLPAAVFSMRFERDEADEMWRIKKGTTDE
jgi:hypothetical protein